jgi:hypothetical protein
MLGPGKEVYVLALQMIRWAALGIVGAALVAWPASAAGPTGSAAMADETVRIDFPTDGAPVTGRIDIRVTIAPSDPAQLDFYRLYVGNGRNPTSLRPLGPPRTAAATNEPIATLDTTVLLAGEATIQLRLFSKNGDQVDTAVVVDVQVGALPTRTFTGPVVVVPPVAVAPPPAQTSAAPPIVEYPAPALLDITVPDFSLTERTQAPIPRLTAENIYDTMPGDPVQTDPILNDLFAPPPPIYSPTSPNLVPIPR